MNREERRRQKKIDKSDNARGSFADNSAALAELKRAKTLFEDGHYEDADELCQDVSAGMPLDAEPFHLRALIQYRLGNLSLAGDMILEAITRNDDDVEIHSNCGAIMNMLGRHAEAEAACRHVIGLNPRRSEAHSNLGVALEMQGRFDEAIEACRKALQLRSNYPEARINLGNLLVRTGDLVGAVETYAVVIEQSPENPTARANMSVVLLRLDEVEAAEVFARQALEINPDYPEALIALGNAEAAQRHYSNAIKAFDAALSVQPQSVEAGLNKAAALHKSGDTEQSISAYRALIVDGHAAGEVFAGLGVVLLASGDLGGAVAAFRSAIEVKPHFGEAHYNLACALGDRVTDAELEAMQKLFSNSKISPTDEIAAHFAVGEVLDKKKAFGKAFEAFAKGNGLRQTMLSTNEIEFDGGEFGGQISLIMDAYPAGFQKATAFTGSDSQVPVFIVGMPRSGTTLVEQIIAAHPEVSSLGEAATVMNLIGDEVDQGGAEFFQTISSEADELFRASGDAKRIVDKTPFHFMHLGAIERLFPGARIIHCRRNAKDVAISCYFQNFVGAYSWATDLNHINRYMQGEEQLMRHWAKVSGLSIMSVDYENLVSDQEGQSRQLIDFLGLEWNDDCLNFHAANSASLTASNWQVRKPIYGTSVNRAHNYAAYMDPS